MALTLEELAARLAVVEKEVRELRLLYEGAHVDETPAERGARMWREARASQAAISAAADKAFKEMGITGEPVGIEKLREMMAASGIKPEENLFSREIIAMREE